jgi:hypothetical protein
MAREEAPQRADRKMMSIIRQPGTDFGQCQIVLLGDQSVDAPCLRLDSV